jgi:alkylation response protein AidB-like acyl-CoA dehydrogenase
MFLPDDELGAGLSVLEYAPIAEQTGRSFIAPEVFNCSAPGHRQHGGLWRYGSPEQKKRWLTPLLAGEIRSVFCMTEPASRPRTRRTCRRRPSSRAIRWC